MKRIVPLLLFIVVSFGASAQQGWVYNGNVNFGCNFLLNYSKGSNAFPGLKVFCGLAINGVYKEHFIVNYGPSISFYTKTIGANLNPLVSDLQIDFINSLSVGAGLNGVSYYKFFRTMDNGSYYNVILNRDYALLLTSNFIVNNHKRNQVNGAITFSFPGITLNYYNDGGAPFYFIPIADNLDRYWTGGLSVFVHTKSGYNHFEASFDQFTGYSPLLFEACSMLGIHMPNYNLQYDEGTHEPKPTNYNTSMYDFKVYLMKGMAVDVGAMGALKLVVPKKRREYYFGLQDIIHVKGGFSMHPNNDNQHIFVGGTYNNFSTINFK